MATRAELGALAAATTVPLSQHLAAMSATRDRTALAVAACEAAGELLGLDGVWMVCRRRGRVGAEHEWLRAGVRAQRLGEARLAELLEACEEGGELVTGLAGRMTTVALPVRVVGEAQGAIVGAVRGADGLDRDTLALGRLVGVHASACLEMIMATSAGRELLELERVAAARPEPEPAPAPGRTGVEPLALLQSLSASLVRARTEHAIGQTVVDELRRLVEHDSCRFSLLSPDGEQLLPVAHRGFSEACVDDLVVAVGEGITGRAFVDGRPLRIDDAASVPDAADLPGGEPMERSMLLAPMIAEAGPIGIVVLTKEGLERFDDHDLHLLEVVAAQAAVACESARMSARQRDAAEVAEALIELGNALSTQVSVDAIARMLALAVDRLLQCAGISVWLRNGGEMTPAALVGYTPQEHRRLMAARVPVTAEPFAGALSTRRVTVVSVDDAPLLAGCLDAAPAGTTFAIVAVGERAANRAAIVVQRGPRRGAPSRREEQMLIGSADQALLAMTNRRLLDELEESFLATVEALGNALDLKDQYTNDHAQALVGLCTAVAERLGLDDATVRDISFAAALHDIGKIGIPLHILNKPGRLTPEELDVMQRHPELGARIIEPVPALAGARELVLACHEHWDGSGYPRGLRAEQIPAGARIILACDAFHAMTSDRVYREAMTIPEAVAELRRCSGSQFEPQVVDALVAVIAANEIEAGG